MGNDKKLNMPGEGSSVMPSLGSAGSVLNKIGLLVVLALISACNRDTSDKVHKVVGERPAVSDVNDSVGLFAPVERADIPKADIPSKLPEFMGALGRVVRMPDEDEYDPLKPNIYLIGDSHLVPPLQKKILQILHKLFALGVKGQCIEGVGRETELFHDKPDPTLVDDPARALPRYKASGVIQSGPFAAEGIYGDELSSRGAEKDLAGGIALQQQHEMARQTVFVEALSEVLVSIAKELGMPADSITSLGEINRKLSQLSEVDRERIKQKCVLGNRSLMGFLRLRAKFLYHRVQGRNADFVETLSFRAVDTAFTVGIKHLLGLIELLKEKKTHNVFAILPQGLSAEDMQAPFTNFTQDDYEKYALKEVLYLVGLGEEVPFLD